MTGIYILKWWLIQAWGLPKGPIYSALKILPENKFLPPFYPSQLHYFKDTTTFWKEVPFTHQSFPLPIASFER